MINSGGLFDDATREERLQRFCSAAEDAGATVHRTVVTEATETIDRTLNGSCVGTTLPFDGVSLPSRVTLGSDHDALKRAETGVTAATCGISTYGSVVISMTEDGEGPTSLLPTRQVAVVAASDLVGDLGTAVDRLETQFVEEGGDAVIVTGPSKTGDMGELVTGVHGPKELHIVVIEDV